jgi:NADH-quinone oxidoreductase subunit L
MVAAGVFLVARFFDLFASSEVVMNSVVLIGGFTALFAATMALVMNDIKRVLAYSTISQLGYMMFALGIGAYGPAIFHLFTHAFFKALLFLGSGSVNHASGSFDMRHMGGLRKVMPWTYFTFLLGGLSLAGIFPLAGFWSKDEILTHGMSVDGFGQIIVWLPIVTVVVTILYIVRAITMVFEGQFRGPDHADHDAQGFGEVHLGESPPVIIVPLVILALATILGGWFINPTIELGVVDKHWLAHFLVTEGKNPDVVFAIVSSLVSITLFGAAYYLFTKGTVASWRLNKRLRPVSLVLSRKYYLDDLYEGVLTVRTFYGGLARLLDWADKAIVDGTVRLIDRTSRNIGKAMAQLQTGQLQGYGVGISIGVLAILGAYLFR